MHRTNALDGGRGKPSKHMYINRSRHPKCSIKTLELEPHLSITPKICTKSQGANKKDLDQIKNQ
uniref:Uncharacterized protein n=1 Tax=Arundo donax TaxID=35708 RepID=A0A0A9BTT5_ARUDO